MDTRPDTPILIITGPTASGKSDVALAAADVLDAEIISADSRQVYRGLDIGTAKPTAAERARVPHHGIDFCAVDEVYTAGRFFEDALRWIADIRGRGKTPLVVGGTGLYVRVLLEGIMDGPERDDALRAELEQRAREEGLDGLVQELGRLDPDVAAQIDVRNPVRVIRALEVCLLTGERYSRLRRETLRRAPYRFAACALQWEREELYARINARVASMLDAGLVAEVRGLLDAGADPASNALNTVGYKEIVGYLTGSVPYADTVEAIKRNTRRFAKRQLTWFRREEQLRWFSVQEEFSPAAVAARMVRSAIG